MSDPALSLRFGVTIDGGDGVPQDMGAFTACQGLSMEYDVFEYQEGGENSYVHRIPGRLRYPNLVLTRAVDSSSGAVAAWFHQQQDKVERTTAVVRAFDPSGQQAAAWTLTGVYPVRWTGPQLDANGRAVATETLELAHDGFTTETA